MKKQIADRQGDVTLVSTDMRAKDVLAKFGKHAVKADARNRVVLAEGEVTGHAHALKNEGVTLLRPPHLPVGHALLVVTETTIERGSFIEGRVIGTMPGGTVRFRQTDGVVMRFAPGDVTVKGDNGVVVNRAYSPLVHDEHDAIPVSKGVHKIIQHQTAEMQGRLRVAD